jgi:tripartite-type tricarboxylate transporter receptor subunit TctC
MRRSLMSLCVLAFLSPALPAAAQNMADTFRGKVVSIVVGFGAGGGYDGYAQMLSQFMGSHIPGEPKVIVRQMPGAGSLAMMNYMAHVAPRDGLTFGIPAASTAFVSLIGSEREREAAKFDARKLGWLGSLESFTPIALAWHQSGFTSIDDLKARDFRYGSSGPASGGESYAELMNALLGTKLKPVRGYKGSNEIALAIERGEIDGIIGWCWTCVKADKPQFITDKTALFLAQIGGKPDPEMQGVPFVLDLIKNDDDRRAAHLVLANLAMGRPFVAPPDLPQGVLKTLREAFVATAKDEALKEFATRTRRVINLMTGEEIDQLLAESYALPKDIVARAIQISAPPP